MALALTLMLCLGWLAESAHAAGHRGHAAGHDAIVVMQMAALPDGDLASVEALEGSPGQQAPLDLAGMAGRAEDAPCHRGEDAVNQCCCTATCGAAVMLPPLAPIARTSMASMRLSEFDLRKCAGRAPPTPPPRG